MEKSALAMANASQDQKKLELSTAEEDKELLVIRNIACAITAALFLIAVCFEEILGATHILLRSIAYLFGAGAYFTEILVLTDKFTVKPAANVMFMPYLFAVLYVILGINYFSNWI